MEEGCEESEDQEKKIGKYANDQKRGRDWGREKQDLVVKGKQKMHVNVAVCSRIVYLEN